MTAPLDCSRRRAPDERPQQILDAALAEFGEQGLAGARLDDIARRAGIAKGTIYLYFANKEELFREVVRQTIVARLDEMTQEFGHAGDATASAQLRAYMRTWWASLRKPAFQIVYRLVVGELHRFPELLQFYLDEVVSRASALHAGVIERGIAAGEFRPADPRVAARIISSTFVAHALWVSHPLQPMTTFAKFGTLLPDEVFAQLEDFAFHALRPPEGARPHPAPDAEGVPTS